MQEMQNAKQEVPLSCQIVKVSDSVFVSKPNSRQHSLYASHLLEEDLDQAYDIELESQTSIGELLRPSLYYKPNEGQDSTYFAPTRTSQCQSQTLSLFTPLCT